MQRILCFESLEVRELLAGNTLATLQAAVNASQRGTPVWHNTTMPADTNGDSLVSPVDALLVIDYLNGGSQACGLPAKPSSTPPFLDSNADGCVTPMDALLVIDHLNAPPQVPEKPFVRQSLQLDFGSGTSPVQKGMTRVTPAHRWAATREYGFIGSTATSLAAISRAGQAASDSQDFIQGKRIDFALRLAPLSICQLEIGMGDRLSARSQKVTIGGGVEQQFEIAAGQVRIARFVVSVPADGVLRVTIRTSGPLPAVMNYLTAETSPGTTNGQGCETFAGTYRPSWMDVIPESQAPQFHSEQYPITCSQQYVTGTNWGGLNERQVFDSRLTVTDADQEPLYEFRLGKGSQLYSFRMRDASGRWREVVGSQGNPAVGTARNSEWTDEVIQTVIVDGELNDPSQDLTKNQIHQAGTYRSASGGPVNYSPMLDQAWLPAERTVATLVWPQQARVPSIYDSNFLLLQQIRDLGSGVIEVTYVYQNMSPNREKATFLASPWLPIRNSSFPVQLRSLANGQVQRDQRDWCPASNCKDKPVSIQDSSGYFVFASGTKPDDAAFTIVFGNDEQNAGQTAGTTFRWGTVRTGDRDLTATSLQKRVRIEPGQVFYHRFYLIANSLQNSVNMARELRNHVDQGFLTGSILPLRNGNRL